MKPERGLKLRRKCFVIRKAEGIALRVVLVTCIYSAPGYSLAIVFAFSTALLVRTLRFQRCCWISIVAVRQAMLLNARPTTSFGALRISSQSRIAQRRTCATAPLTLIRGLAKSPQPMRSFFKRAQVAINACLRQYNKICPHHALNMRQPIAEILPEKPQITGTETVG